MLAAAEQVIGSPVPHSLVGRRPGDPVALYADTGRSREVPGWVAERGLDDILASGWHSAHLDRYED